jgi:hypothetical protein
MVSKKNQYYSRLYFAEVIICNAQHALPCSRPVPSITWKELKGLQLHFVET